MKQYSERELYKKIHAFITSKTEQYPELARIERDTIDQARMLRNRASSLRDMFSVRLKPIFKSRAKFKEK